MYVRLPVHVSISYRVYLPRNAIRINGISLHAPHHKWWMLQSLIGYPRTICSAIRQVGNQGLPWHNRKARLDKSDRKSTRLNSSHVKISYAVFCLKKKNIA